MAQPRSDLPGKTYPEVPVRIKDLPDEMKPREEFEARGAQQVSTATLLAILLRAGIPGKNVSALAYELLSTFGGIDKLFAADYNELVRAKIKGFGKVKCMELAAAIELGRRALLTEKPASSTSIRSPEEVYARLKPLLHNVQQEVFWVILLDTKNKPIGLPIEVSRGILDSTPVHAREIYAKAIRCHAGAIILAHNHPSGDATPSREDIEITRRIIEAGRIIGIPVFDHIVVGSSSRTENTYVSLRERGLVNFKA